MRVPDNPKTICSDRLGSRVLEASARHLCCSLGAGEWQVPPGNVESPAGWQEVSPLRVSQNIRHFDHVVPADRSPQARSRLEGAKTRPRTDGRKPGWQRRPRKTCPGRNWPRSGTSERKQLRAARQRRCRWHTCLSLDLPPPWDIVLLCTAATTASVSQDRERKGRRTRLSGSAPGRCSLSLHSQGLARTLHAATPQGQSSLGNVVFHGWPCPS